MLKISRENKFILFKVENFFKRDEKTTLEAFYLLLLFEI